LGLVNPLTQVVQVSVQLPIIEGTQVDQASVSMIDDMARQAKEGCQSFPGGLSISLWEELISGPHHQIRQRQPQGA
jgi:hypothetical protein